MLSSHNIYSGYHTHTYESKQIERVIQNIGNSIYYTINLNEAIIQFVYASVGKLHDFVYLRVANMCLPAHIE